MPIIYELVEWHDGSWTLWEIKDGFERCIQTSSEYNLGKSWRPYTNTAHNVTNAKVTKLTKAEWFLRCL